MLEALYDPAQRLVEKSLGVSPIRPQPLRCDSFIARSVLQKAIRRGERYFALRAASTLMTTNSAVIWRRLLVTAMEDLGIHQFGLLLKMAAAIERRRLGHGNAEEWPLIALLVEECCSASRCQAANDLLNLSVNSPRYERTREIMAGLHWNDLIAIARDPENDLIDRTIAMLSCLGPDHAPWVLHRPLGELETLLAAVAPHLPPFVRTTYAWAFRKTRLSLAPISVLLIAVEGSIQDTLVSFDDSIPPHRLLHGIPGFALDQYTRTGRRAIRDFLTASERWRDFATSAGLSILEQHAAVGELVFRAEGAVVTRRCSWDIARVLFQQSSVMGCHIAPELVDEGIPLIRSELPLLDDLRERRLRMAL